MTGPRLIVGHPHDHCAECCTNPRCSECWPTPALSIERHQVPVDLYPADPEARAHEASSSCWCEPVVQVVHRTPPTKPDVPALREAGAL